MQQKEKISKRYDNDGNYVYRKNDSIRLKLVGVNYAKKIADIEGKNFITHRKLDKHLFSTTNSFGFNHLMLASAAIIKNLEIRVDNGDVYNIPLTYIRKHPTYLHFKVVGYERQVFLTLEELQQFKIN